MPLDNKHIKALNKGKPMKGDAVDIDAGDGGDWMRSMRPTPKTPKKGPKK